MAGRFTVGFFVCIDSVALVVMMGRLSRAIRRFGGSVVRWFGGSVVRRR